MKQFLFIFSICIMTIGCDCLQQVTGTVYDYETKVPIDSVAYGVTPILTKDNSQENLNYKRFTNENGYFDWKSMNGGLLCPRIKIYFIKEGYEIKSKSFKSCCREEVQIELKKDKRQPTAGIKYGRFSSEIRPFSTLGTFVKK